MLDRGPLLSRELDHEPGCGWPHAVGQVTEPRHRDVLEPSFRRLSDVEPAWRAESSFSFPTPAVEVTEDNKTYKITAELPGLEQKDIEITLSDKMLILKGEKRYEKEEKDRHVSERAYGSFQRSFTIPETIDREKIGADLAKGVLTITLPKAAAAQKPEKKIEIKAAA